MLLANSIGAFHRLRLSNSVYILPERFDNRD
jgi:hypothetical protein